MMPVVTFPILAICIASGMAWKCPKWGNLERHQTLGGGLQDEDDYDEKHRRRNRAFESKEHAFG
eukprot:4910036-Prorocentrum_lima.AAC.1